MKKLLLLLTLGISLNTFAQIHVGSNQIATLNKAGKISDENFKKLKNTTTLFTLQYKDYEELESFEKMISSVWTVTPFKIISPDELGSYSSQNGYSLFTFGGYVVRKQGAGHNSAIHLTYDLWMPEINDKGKKKFHYFSKISLFYDHEAYMKLSRVGGFFNKINNKKFLPYLYNDAVFYNWNAGFLKGYLKTVNDLLEKNEIRGPYSNFKDQEGLNALKNDTLYLPEYPFIKYNPLGLEGKSPTIPTPEEIQKRYAFPVKIVSDKQLNAMIIEDADIKYMIYTKSSTDKFISVYNSKDGKMLFTHYIKVAYNFKNKDLAIIEKAIE